MSLAASSALPGGSEAYAASGIALVALSLVVARVIGLDRRSLGLAAGPGAAARGALLGVVVGASLGALGVALLLIVAPLVLGERIAYAPLAQISGPRLLWHSAVLLPVGVVVPEEVAFRGVLLGGLVRERGRRAAIALSAAAFALWHGSVVVPTVAQTAVAGPWAAAAITGAFAVVAVGGVALALLRLRSGTLLASAGMHWAFNVAVLAGLWVRVL